MIKYLHENLGFNTLIFESSIINGYYLRESLNTSDNFHQMARETVYHIWSEAEETQDLFNYIKDQNQKTQGLNLVGIDPQFSGSSSYSLFLKELKSLLPDSFATSNTFKDFQNELSLISTWMEFPQKEEHKITLKEFFQITDSIQTEIQNNLNAEDLERWQVFFENIKILAEIKWYKNKDGAFAARDKQMFKNLDRFLKNNPTEKCIVWAANGHIIRKDSELKGNKTIWKGIKKLGDYINENYSIGFTSHKGHTSDWSENPKKKLRIKKSKKGSLEHQLKDFDSVLVDLNLFEKENNLENYTSQLLYINIRCKSTWSNNFDGVIFFNTMYPSQKSYN